MACDLPELPFVPASLVPEEEEQREAQFEELEKTYVDLANTAFDSVIARCSIIGIQVAHEDSFLTDDKTIADINLVIEDLDNVYLYLIRILRRQKSLCAHAKMAKTRSDINKMIQTMNDKTTDTRKNLQLLKHKVFNVKNKQQLEKLDAEYKLLELKQQVGGARAEQSSSRCKEVTSLKPEKLTITDPASQMRKFKREFAIYYEASNFQAANQNIQAGYLMLLIDKSLEQEMGHDPDKLHWIYPEQCVRNGLPEEESIMSMMEVAWKRTHPIHTNRCELFNIVQREGESYAELLQRIQDTWKECEIDGLLDRKALESHVIYNALKNVKHKKEILRKNELKVNLDKADIDSVCKTEEHIRYFTQANNSIFESGRLGPSLPSNSVNRVDHRTERRGSGSSSSGFGATSSGFGGSRGKFNHLQGQAKFEAIRKEQGMCSNCLKRHLGQCDLVRDNIRCPKCDKGCHTAEACCHVEGQTLIHQKTRRGGASRGTKRRFDGSKGGPPNGE